MRAHLRYARISPKKVNLVASMVRRKSVPEALFLLSHLPKKGATLLHGVISSAAANAENNAKQRRDALFIKEIIVNKGSGFRRFIPIARGRARGIIKWTSHLSVELGVLVPEDKKKSAPASASTKATRSTSSGQAADKKAKADKKVKEEKKKEKEKKQEDIETVEKVDLRGGGASEVDSTFDSSADPHQKGADSDKGGSTFQAHRQGGRGS